jgi:hypothetical protein
VTASRSPRDERRIIEAFGAARPDEPQAARFLAWYGWRPSQGTRCPRSLAGKKCSAYDHRGGTCICDRFRSRVLDHPRRWITRDGEHILTAEPYQFDGEDFAELVTECAQIGLEVSVRGLSPYFPGRTVLLTVRKATP